MYIISVEFYVPLTVHLGMIFVNNQLDAQFFMYVYIYSLHILGSHVPIIRRIIVSMWYQVYITPCRWPSGTHTSVDDSLVCIPVGHLHGVTQWHKPGIALSWWWAHGCPKHVENRNKHTRKNCLRHHVTLCRWPSGTHTRRSSTQSDINQASHWHNNSPDDRHVAGRNM